MPTLDTCGGGEFPDIIVASFFALDTGSDAVTFGLDLRECKVDFRSNSGYIEASDIYNVSKGLWNGGITANASTTSNGERVADSWLRTPIIISFDDSGSCGGGKDEGNGCENRVKHCVYCSCVWLMFRCLDVWMFGCFVMICLGWKSPIYAVEIV
jgi:hypothetical protein